MARTSHQSSEWKAIVVDGRKRLGITQKTLGEKVGVTGAYVVSFENGWVPARPLVEKIAYVLGVPTEDALLACGYANQNIVRCYRRYLDAIKTNTPMKPGVVTIGKTSTKPSSKDLVAALSELVGEFEGLRTENQQMSAKLSKIQAAFA